MGAGGGERSSAAAGATASAASSTRAAGESSRHPSLLAARVPFGPSTVTLVTEIGYPGSDQDDAKLMAGQSGAVSVACSSSSTVLWMWRQVARTALGWPNQARSTNSRCDD